MKRPTQLILCLWFFAISQLVSVFADRLKQFSLVGMVGLVNPGSSAELLRLGLVMHLPMLVAAPLFGALLDRWSKSVTIMGVNVSRALLIAAIPIVFAWTASIYAIYAVLLFVAVADLLFSAARSSLIPEFVPTDRLLQVNAVFWGLGVVGTLAGFALGGWLFDYRSWQSSFHANAVGYALAAVIMVPVLFLHRFPTPDRNSPHPEKGRRTTLSEGVREIVVSISDGLHLIRENRNVAVSLGTQTALFAFGGVLYVIAISRIQSVFPPGRTIYLSVVTTSLLVGLLMSAWLAGYYRHWLSPQRTIAVATLTCGVCLVGIARNESVVTLSIWAGLIGFSTSPVFVFTEALLQTHTPQLYRGRIFSTREILIKAAFLSSAVLSTMANAVFSKSAILVAVGLFLAFAGVLLERTKWLELSDNDG
jgi:MFS family permease